MRPDEGDLDEEIRGHLAINIKERIDRGEDPVSARRAALLEFGYVPAVRDQMRRVWYSRWYDEAEALALAPERLNAFVFSALGGIALLISVVGVAGVLAVSVSARTREFGVRLAVGSTPRALRTGVLWDGMRIAAIGIAAGAAAGYALVRVAQGFFGNVQLPGALPATGAAVVLFGAAVGASLMPATRASRVDVLQALRSE
jgi:putative ABC transport system permease protein